MMLEFSPLQSNFTYLDIMKHSMHDRQATVPIQLSAVVLQKITDTGSIEGGERNAVAT